ncbi:MAG TPA: maleylpyruvate isomerase family mycothiol-dependent enzyme, partial [Acidimicrobiales bacterium]|nr:maleylpyruvate isomerase family mycothiol-dependent enzyme [Acidimicrobiales bacterium]
MTEALDVLGASVARLRGVVEGLDPDELVAQAYPSEWRVADVLSHLGSGAVIFRRWADDALAGRSTPEDFAPSVWDEWNAKSPAQVATDLVRADQDYLERLVAADEAERTRFSFSIGPLTTDFAGFVQLRLNEHVLHSWDVVVVGDPGAGLPPDATALIVDNLRLTARFSGKPPGEPTRLTVRTTAPGRDIALELGPDEVGLVPLSGPDVEARPDLELPAEALVRLVYGRLDP